MLRITENNDELIVREIPVAKWISIILWLIVAGLSIYLVQSLAKNKGAFEWHWFIEMIVGILILIVIFFIIPATTIKINKKSKFVSIRKRSLVKKTSKVYAFSEIADLIYVDEIKVQGIEYRLILPLKNGQKEELSALISRNEGQYFKTADLMNKYIFDSPTQIPFKLTVFLDD